MCVESNNVKISLTVKLPSALLRAFLQHVRNFESRNSDDVHIAMAVDSPSLAVDELEKMFRDLDPPPAFIQALRKVKD